MKQTKLKLILCILLVYFFFNDRIVIIFNTGGKGILNIFEFIIIGLAIYILLRSKRNVLAILKNKLFLYFSPFFFLSILLPLVAVLIYQYPIRSLLIVLNPVISFSLIIIGFYISKVDKDLTSFNKYLIIFTFLQLFFSAIHFLYYKGIFTNLFSSFINLDIHSKNINSIQYLSGRSTGTYLDPNILGFFTIVIFWYTFFMIKGKMRLIMIVMSLIILFLSMSRGAILAIIISVIIYFFTKIFNLKKVSYKEVILILLISLGLILFIPNIEKIISENTVERLSGLFRIFVYGYSADANLAARVDAWKYSFEFLDDYPLGTFGSPEMQIGSFIDNEYVRIFMQGGLLFLVSYLLFLFKGIFLKKKDSAINLTIAFFSVSILVVSITQTASTYTPFNFYWFFIGLFLAETYKNKNTFY